jgi:LysM repeat protein
MATSSGKAKISPKAAEISLGEYIVQPGDTLSSIAKRSGVSASELQNLNDLGDPSRLQVGKKLVIARAAQVIPSTLAEKQIQATDRIAGAQGDRINGSQPKAANYDFMNDSDFFQGIDNIPIVQVSE